VPYRLLNNKTVLMETLEPLLAGHPFFKGLDPPYLKTLTGCASNGRFAAGEMIFREGEEANKFFLVREGKIAIEVFVEGRGPLTIQTLSAGEILGWSWLVPPYQYRFDARAVDAVRAIALDGAPTFRERVNCLGWIRCTWQTRAG